MKKTAGDTRSAILDAAATEFAAHGFAGASVDAIAARSRFNKAMIYYHFGSKQDLYLEILRDTFRQVGRRTHEIAEAELPPRAKIEAFIDVFSDMAASRPYMPPMMMREMAEGATRLDADTLLLMSRIIGNLGRVLEEGARLGVFRAADPILTYFTLASPVIFFRAAQPLREAFGRQHLLPVDHLDADRFVAHLKTVVGALLTAGHEPTPPAGPRKASAKRTVASRPPASPRKRTRSTRPGDHV